MPSRHPTRAPITLAPLALVIPLLVCIVAAPTHADTTPPTNTASTADRPTAIADLTPAQARRAAIDQNKLLLLKGTAVWCGPCRTMDRTVWTDPRIIDWVQQHAVAAPLDIDRYPTGARRLNIQGVPTIVLFDATGTERARRVGMADADTMLTWLEAVRTGEESDIPDPAEEFAEATQNFRKMVEEGANAQIDFKDPSTRIVRAASLLMLGRTDEALTDLLFAVDAYVHLEPDDASIEHLYTLATQLVHTSFDARDAIANKRDRIARRIFPDVARAHPGAVAVWIVLNQALGDQRRSATLLSTALRQHTNTPPSLQHTAVYDTLIGFKFWSDAGRIFPDPHTRADHLLAKAAESIQLWQSPVAERPRIDEHPTPDHDAHAQDARSRNDATEDRGFVERLVRNEQLKHARDLANLYAALLAADRDTEAEAIAALDTDPIPRADVLTAFVRTAITAGEPRPHHRAWLDDADATQRLRDRLDRALTQQTSD